MAPHFLFVYLCTLIPSFLKFTPYKVLLKFLLLQKYKKFGLKNPIFSKKKLSISVKPNFWWLPCVS